MDRDQPWWVWPALVAAVNDEADAQAEAREREELGLPDVSNAHDVSADPNAMFRGM